MIDFPRVSIETLRQYERDGKLKVEQHPIRDLFIWNYTRECQYTGLWDEITLACRGLITDSTGRIIARPFPKFFNLDEHERVTGRPLPDEPFKVTEKLDGSLIIATRCDDGFLLVASRGSFVSEQARIAHRLLTKDDRDDFIARGITYCFELIHPANRIVVDYGDRVDLVLLAAFELATGEELVLLPQHASFPLVRRIEHAGGFRELPQHPNEEGYVLQFLSGLRLKIKNEEYVRLHRLLTSTSPNAIWEAMRDGVPFEELLEHVPDEFDAWARGVRGSIQAGVDGIAAEASSIFQTIDTSQTRKEIALQIQQYPTDLQPILFCMLDGKDWMKYVWKLVKPTNAAAFRAGEES